MVTLINFSSIKSIWKQSYVLNRIKYTICSIHINVN